MKNWPIVIVFVVLFIAAFLGYWYFTTRRTEEDTFGAGSPAIVTKSPATSEEDATGEDLASTEDDDVEEKGNFLKLSREQAEELRPRLVNLPLQVTNVVDGDTIDIELPAGLSLSGIVRVRLGGIEAPECGAPYSKKAREKALELTASGKVTLEFDKSFYEDKYGRLIAYVFCCPPDDADGRGPLLNVEMVRAGFAFASIYTENEKYASELVAAQRAARAAKLGIWQHEKKGDEQFYLADRTRWRFHRPNCEWAKKIPQDKLVRYESRGAAFDEGKSPCWDCKP